MFHAGQRLEDALGKAKFDKLDAKNRGEIITYLKGLVEKYEKLAVETND